MELVLGSVIIGTVLIGVFVVKYWGKPKANDKEKEKEKPSFENGIGVVHFSDETSFYKTVEETFKEIVRTERSRTNGAFQLSHELREISIRSKSCKDDLARNFPRLCLVIVEFNESVSVIRDKYHDKENPRYSVGSMCTHSMLKSHAIVMDMDTIVEDPSLATGSVRWRTMRTLHNKGVVFVVVYVRKSGALQSDALYHEDLEGKVKEFPDFIRRGHFLVFTKTSRPSKKTS